ncbi:unnamed protein product [Psylliodes chrysocephalus]|uniref:Mutator-like transposase domain-containing protein n=1 Tax=Psylliodes chrysocephalus TaxID=3402493 RepID=A0A9P0DBB3_9CUCU|nr:unnamed protein product [Psylliodes chrysocephala]
MRYSPLTDRQTDSRGFVIGCERVLSLENITNETRKGLYSILNVKCNECNIETIVPTDKVHATKSEVTHSDVNTKAVLEQENGFKTLERRFDIGRKISELPLLSLHSTFLTNNKIKIKQHFCYKQKSEKLTLQDTKTMNVYYYFHYSDCLPQNRL